MSITFNAAEIFQMAEQIERNGAKFYNRAGAVVADRRAKQMFHELADMEKEHEVIFAEMRKQLSDRQRRLMVFDPENEAALYLQAMAGGHVFDIRRDISEQLTGAESMADILRMALEAEKDSIVFYLGIKKFVPEKAGKEKIDSIIDEEMGHITVLNRIGGFLPT